MRQPRASKPSSETQSGENLFPIVGIGASAGGLEAFTQVLRLLPSDTGMAFVLIQHLDPKHASLLCDALAKVTSLPIGEVVDGEPVLPDRVYVIPPSADIAILRGRLTLVPRSTDTRLPHLPIDFFLRSLAVERGSRAIGVVLSGNASDGTEGLRAIKSEDGITFAQEPNSAKFDGMPRSAVDAGVADYSLAIPDLVAELLRLSRHSYLAPRHEHSSTNAPLLKQVCVIVRDTVGVDFSEYKAATFERRVARRMALRRIEDLKAYLALLRGDVVEIRALYEDVLIHVTTFFRDPEVFEAIKARALPKILRDKAEGAPIRVWVAGCSSGEEVYSIAMVLLETLGDSSRPIQLFGSDVSATIIEVARAGIYSDNAMRDVSDARRRRFFTKTEQGYRINKGVRDSCIFVQHDLARDPPFSRLDLVSCRNVLIYFEPDLQKRVFPTFHYALSQPGFLVLGRTESIAGFDRFFATDDANHIFSRNIHPSALRFAPRMDSTPSGIRSVDPASTARPHQAVDMAKHVDRLLLSRYAPPGVLINERLEVVHFSGQTGAYLQAAPGEPQNNLVKMARGGLLGALRSTIARARKEVVPARQNGVELDPGVGPTCNIIVIPFTGLPEMREPLYLVLFEDAARFVPDANVLTDVASPATACRPPESLPGDLRVPKLEHELSATKEYLQFLIDEHVRTTDDLGSANEELVSGNEELQSMNEELETAKEELQSTNEELTTVNEELRNRNQEANQVNSDLVNLFAIVDIPILILDAERRIRRFTPKARSILNVLPSDIGRPLDDIKTNIDVPTLDRQIADVIESLVMKETEVRDREGRWYRMQIRPYRTVENRIDGAILSLVDIHSMKQIVGEAQQAGRAAEQANRAKDQFLAVLSHELRTPLTSILLNAQLLRGVGHDRSRTARVAAAIERATKMQVQLIDDLLDVSGIVSGKFPYRVRAVRPGGLGASSHRRRRRVGRAKVFGDAGQPRNSACHGARRPSSLAAGRFEPPDECHQVHSRWRARHDRARIRGGLRASRGGRQRQRNSRQLPAPCLQSFRPREQHPHASSRRPWSRTRHRAAHSRGARWNRVRREPRHRQRVDLLGHAAAHDGQNPRHASAGERGNGPASERSIKASLRERAPRRTHPRARRR